MSTYDKLVALHEERTSELASAFLKALLEVRTDTQALLATGMQYGLLHRLIKRDAVFAESYNDIHDQLREVIKCRKCGSLWKNDGKKRGRRTGGVFGVCDVCNSTRYTQYFNTPNARMKRLLRSMSGRSQCSLTLNDMMKVYERQNGMCFFSKKSMSFESGPDCVSPDRLDPKGGYAKDNIVLCRRRINLMKRSLTVIEFVTACNAVTNPLSMPPSPMPSRTECHMMLNNIKRRGVSCAIAVDDMMKTFELQKGNCHYTKWTMIPYRMQANFKQMSVDRIDSGIGYEVGNIVFCCLGINLMKMSMDINTFKDECATVHL